MVGANHNGQSHRSRDHNRSRSRSPHREHAHSHRDKRRRTEDEVARVPRVPATLPLHARELSKNDYGAFKALFTLYLDVQKEIRLEDLDEKEARGRWKSFLGKWNRGELAQGWYDPATKQRADEGAADVKPDGAKQERRSPEYGMRAQEQPVHKSNRDNGESSDDDDFGPSIPAQTQLSQRVGPSIPNADDLSLVAELRAEDAVQDLKQFRTIRKAERTIQKERLDELAPRADPGSRERQLEKKREVRATVAAFKDAKDGGEVEMKDSDLMGDEGLEGFKKRKGEMERKKNERELRKEEQLRVRIAEREERLQKSREKESKTMEYLKGLARERYG